MQTFPILRDLCAHGVSIKRFDHNHPAGSVEGGGNKTVGHFASIENLVLSKITDSPRLVATSSARPEKVGNV